MAVCSVRVTHAKHVISVSLVLGCIVVFWEIRFANSSHKSACILPVLLSAYTIYTLVDWKLSTSNFVLPTLHNVLPHISKLFTYCNTSPQPTMSDYTYTCYICIVCDTVVFSRLTWSKSKKNLWRCIRSHLASSLKETVPVTTSGSCWPWWELDCFRYVTIN